MMSDYNWCHNPDCHTNHTTDRVRGVKGKKVLRTRKISLNTSYMQNSIWSFFCNNKCLFQFLNKFRQQVANINPTTEPSEIPIHDPIKKTHTYNYGYGDHTYTTTEIKPIEQT